MRLSLFAALHPVERVAIALLALVMLMMTVPIARAAEAGAAATTVDFGPWIDAALDLLAPAIGAVISLLAMWVLRRVALALGLEIDASRRAALEQGLGRAIDYAVARVGDRRMGAVPIDLHSAAVAAAAGYAERSVPGALRHFEVTPTRLREMIEARLESRLCAPPEAAASAIAAPPVVSTASDSGAASF